RELLRQRLVRRGVALPAGLLAAGLAQGAAPALVPASLVATTVKAGMLLAAGGSMSVGGISAGVLELAGGAVKAMSMTTGMKAVTALLFVVGLGAAGAGVAFQQTPVARQPEAKAVDGGSKEKSQPQPRAEEQARTDRYGDPLPLGVIARLG